MFRKLKSATQPALNSSTNARNIILNIHLKELTNHKETVPDDGRTQFNVLLNEHCQDTHDNCKKGNPFYQCSRKDHVGTNII